MQARKLTSQRSNKYFSAVFTTDGKSTGQQPLNTKMVSLMVDRFVLSAMALIITIQITLRFEPQIVQGHHAVEPVPQ